jgi:hypothetical protein
MNFKHIKKLCVKYIDRIKGKLFNFSCFVGFPIYQIIAIVRYE